MQENLGEVVYSLEPYMIDPAKLLVNAGRYPSDTIARRNSERLAAPFAIWVMPRRISLLLSGLMRLICSP